MSRATRILLSVGIAVLFAGLVPTAGPALATFSGTNGKIAFFSDATGSLQLYTMNADGTGVTQLTNTPNLTARYPAWSPDGTKIAFRGFANGNADIYVINADGSGLQRLTTEPSVESVPAWTPNGKQIVFASNRNDPNPTTCFNAELCHYDLFIMNADGSHERQLASSPSPAADFFPRVSPDDNTIAFTSTRSGSYAIWTMTTNGTAIHQVTPNSMQAGGPDWSPNGTKILFGNNSCSTCANSDLFVMDANGQNVTQLTSNFGNNFSAKWSPDGTKIVFGHNDPATAPPDIWVMNADGTGRTDLTNSPTVDDFAPDWGSLGH
jgi:Tol biopolymer transport system component